MMVWFLTFLTPLELEKLLYRTNLCPVTTHTNILLSYRFPLHLHFMANLWHVNSAPNHTSFERAIACHS